MNLPAYRKRRYYYRLVNAALGVAIVYGLVNGHEAAALGIFANAALGLADANARD